MPGLGTIVNTAAVLAGSFLGLLLKRGIPERIREMIFHAIGVATMLLGISGVLSGLFRVGTDGLLTRENVMLLIFCLVGGSVLGELWNLEGILERFAQYLRMKVAPRNPRIEVAQKEEEGFVPGFVNASLLFCVGAMALVGAMEDGAAHNPATLYAKSIMDGVMACLLASAYGIGVALSALTVAVYQGVLTALSAWLLPYCPEEALLQMSMAGSALILCIGLNLLNVTRIRVANMLPATFLPLLYSACTLLLARLEPLLHGS